MSGHDDDSKPSLDPTTQNMMDASSLSATNPSTHYSGDGTWTEGHVICALVPAGGKDAALAKASAAFSHRDDRPDPLFSHKKTETFELAVELKSLPLAIAETEWDEHPPISELGSKEAEAAVEQAIDDSEFNNNDSIIYNEWGEKFTSEKELRSHLEDLDDGWIVVGVGLKPTGSGEGHDEYIGNTYDILCPQCDEVGAECVNIVFEDRANSHIGVWDCESCMEVFRGPHPDGAENLGRFMD